jgi:hypothetical protein
MIYLADFWRVTIYHQKGEVAHQNMRVLQLEHNTNVLLQELSDMHEHADKTRREHVTQLASMHSLQEDVAQERAATTHLRRTMSEQGTSLAKAESDFRTARAEAAQLQERIVAMDAELRNLAMDTAEKSGAAILEVRVQLGEERNRSGMLAKTIVEKDAQISAYCNEIKVPPSSNSSFKLLTLCAAEECGYHSPQRRERCCNRLPENNETDHRGYDVLSFSFFLRFI